MKSASAACKPSGIWHMQFKKALWSKKLSIMAKIHMKLKKDKKTLFQKSVVGLKKEVPGRARRSHWLLGRNRSGWRPLVDPGHPTSG